MGTEDDYYQILELKTECTDAEIKQAYRSKAIQWHPLKNDTHDKELVRDKFRSIGEAYTILSDPKLRTIFDQYGAKGLKNGIPNGKGGLVGAWSYSRDPEEQFSDFFGSISPFADFFSGDPGFIPMFQDTQPAKKGKSPSQVINLFCSLEELYQGCSKKVKVSRQKLNLDGTTCDTEEVVMTVEVQAGWREGTKITFTCEGDEAPEMSTGDVVFVLKEKPHPRFVRAKNDLVYTASINLSQALTGCIVEVKMLDGRVLPIPITEIVKPNHPKRVPKEGMPLVNSPGKGDLVIEFDVQFPDMLSETQKGKIRAILAES